MRGIVGGSVEAADLANVTIQLNDHRECSVQVLCAICSVVNEDLILTKDVVDQLFRLYNLDVVSRVSFVKNMNDALANDDTVNSERVIIDNVDCEHENIDDHAVSNINEMLYLISVTSSMLNVSIKPNVMLVWPVFKH